MYILAVWSDVARSHAEQCQYRDSQQLHGQRAPTVNQYLCGVGVLGFFFPLAFFLRDLALPLIN